jgi:hypothetical protein
MLGRLMGVVRQGRGRIIAACAAVAVGLTAFAVGHAATETAALIKVRMGGDSAETRLVIDLDGATSAKIVSDGAADPSKARAGASSAPGWSIRSRAARASSWIWRATPG